MFILHPVRDHLFPFSLHSLLNIILSAALWYSSPPVRHLGKPKRINICFLPEPLGMGLRDLPGCVKHSYRTDRTLTLWVIQRDSWRMAEVKEDVPEHH